MDSNGKNVVVRSQARPGPAPGAQPGRGSQKTVFRRQKLEDKEGSRGNISGEAEVEELSGSGGLA